MKYVVWSIWIYSAFLATCALVSFFRPVKGLSLDGEPVASFSQSAQGLGTSGVVWLCCTLWLVRYKEIFLRFSIKTMLATITLFALLIAAVIDTRVLLVTLLAVPFAVYFTCLHYNGFFDE